MRPWRWWSRGRQRRQRWARRVWWEVHLLDVTQHAHPARAVFHKLGLHLGWRGGGLELSRQGRVRARTAAQVSKVQVQDCRAGPKQGKQAGMRSAARTDQSRSHPYALQDR